MKTRAFKDDNLIKILRIVINYHCYINDMKYLYISLDFCAFFMQWYYVFTTCIDLQLVLQQFHVLNGVQTLRNPTKYTLIILKSVHIFARNANFGLMKGNK